MKTSRFFARISKRNVEAGLFTSIIIINLCKIKFTILPFEVDYAGN